MTRGSSHRELKVYRRAFDLAMRLFDISESFPSREAFALTDQMRRSSRSGCANLAEAWRKRRYRAAFISKLSDAEAEAAETQTWIEFAVARSLIQPEVGAELMLEYESLLGSLVGMIHHADDWIIPSG